MQIFGRVAPCIRWVRVRGTVIGQKSPRLSDFTPKLTKLAV